MSDPYKYRVVGDEDGWVLLDNTGTPVELTVGIVRAMVSAYNQTWLFWTDEGEEALWGKENEDGS